MPEQTKSGLNARVASPHRVRRLNRRMNVSETGLIAACLVFSIMLGTLGMVQIAVASPLLQ